jgi:hypothetical protein
MWRVCGGCRCRWVWHKFLLCLPFATTTRSVISMATRAFPFCIKAASWRRPFPTALAVIVAVLLLFGNYFHQTRRPSSRSVLTSYKKDMVLCNTDLYRIRTVENWEAVSFLRRQKDQRRMLHALPRNSTYIFTMRIIVLLLSYQLERVWS